MENLETFFGRFTPEQIAERNAIEAKKIEEDHKRFADAYGRWECSLCWRALKVFSSEKPCPHYLLRLNNGFKKKHFEQIFKRWGYFNIASYVRWVANLERYVWGINNLREEKDERKKFEYTVKWKLVDWTFSCAHTDFQGHSWAGSNFPHYHFQMRIDGRAFIDFTDFHIPFSDEDLFLFESIEGGYMEHSWWNGIGIQEAADLLDSTPDKWIGSMRIPDDENDAQFRVQTFVNGPITWDEIADMARESQRTGKTMAQLFKERLGEDKVKSVVSPADTIPDIAARKWWRWGKKNP